MSTSPTPTAMVAPKDGPSSWLRNAERWLDGHGRKAWIVAMILGFIFFWPLGLALLAYMIWSKRMFNRSCAHKSDRSGPWSHASHGPFTSTFRSSGNAAFDAYTAETLRRLQEEQEAFEAFLQRLRDAKDKSEFDSFMADRARSTATTPPAVPDADTPRSGAY